MKKFSELEYRRPRILRVMRGVSKCVKQLKKAADFAKKLNARAVDASAQLYKADCPPAVLLKPPVISSEKALSRLADLIAGLL